MGNCACTQLVWLACTKALEIGSWMFMYASDTWRSLFTSKMDKFQFSYNIYKQNIEYFLLSKYWINLVRLFLYCNCAHKEADKQFNNFSSRSTFCLSCIFCLFKIPGSLSIKALQRMLIFSFFLKKFLASSRKCSVCNKKYAQLSSSSGRQSAFKIL